MAQDHGVANKGLGEKEEHFELFLRIREFVRVNTFMVYYSPPSKRVNREFKQSTTPTATRTSANKRFNE